MHPKPIATSACRIFILASILILSACSSTPTSPVAVTLEASLTPEIEPTAASTPSPRLDQHLPGGPDSLSGQERYADVPLAAVPAVQPAGMNRFLLDADTLAQLPAANLKAQAAQVAAALQNAGLQVVETEAELIETSQVVLEFVEYAHPDQYVWTIGVRGQNGLWRTVNPDGSFTWNPSYLTPTTRWVLVEDGLGNQVSRGFEFIDGQWVGVSRAKPDGNAAAVAAETGIIYNPQLVLEVPLSDGGMKPLLLTSLPGYDSGQTPQTRVETDRVVVNGIPYVWDGSRFVEAFFEVSGGNLRQWDESQGRYVAVRVAVEGSAQGSETVKAEKMIALSNGGLAVIADNKVVAKLGADRSVTAADAGVIDRGDGWFLAWDKETQALVDAVQIRSGQLWSWSWDKFVPVTDGENLPVRGSEVQPAGGEYGWVVLDNDQIRAYIDKKGSAVPAFTDQVLVGYRVMAWEGGTLVDTGQAAMEFLISMPGHETITSTGVGPEITVTFAEKAFGIDTKFWWRNEAIFRQLILEMAMERMKDDGFLERSVTYSQFVQWLKAGNVITLKKQDAINARTGEPEPGLFHNLPVKVIRFYCTDMDLSGTGIPHLPVEGGKTRYAPTNHPLWAFDSIYDPNEQILYLIGEIKNEVVIRYYKYPDSIGSESFGVSLILLRVPHGILIKYYGGISLNGRPYYQVAAEHNGSEIYNRLLLNYYPIGVRVEK